MTSSLGGSGRRCRGLTDIVPQYDDSQSDKVSRSATLRIITVVFFLFSSSLFPVVESIFQGLRIHVCSMLQFKLYRAKDQNVSNRECSDRSEVRFE